jgi:hypothetical protein
MLVVAEDGALSAKASRPAGPARISNVSSCACRGVNG